MPRVLPSRSWQHILQASLDEYIVGVDTDFASNGCRNTSSPRLQMLEINTQYSGSRPTADQLVADIPRISEHDRVLAETTFGISLSVRGPT